MADIQERLRALGTYPFEDNQRNIESATLSISIASIAESNYAERNAFDSKFLGDVYTISKMRDVLERGEYFVNSIYTYRSCSKAIPQAKNADDANFKEELNAKTYEVLEPEIKKVKDLFVYQKETIQFFCEQVKLQIADNRKTEVPAEAVLWNMIKIIDLLALLDALLNMKACLVTDFSFYKRAIGFLKPDDAQQDKQLAEQGLFLAKQNRITEHFKNEIKEIRGFDEILVLLVNMCASYIETERYVLPSDKHTLLRVIPYALFLMDGREGNLVNIFKSKKINVKRFATIFKRFPIVTLYGDMQIKLENMIKSAPNYTPGVWPLADTDRLARDYEIIHHLPSIRQQHTEYMGKYNTLINMIKIDEPEFDDDDLCTEVTNNLLDGLSLISNWTSRVLQQSAWKYFKPNTEEGESVENSYEQVVKRNYSKEERFALAEMIGLIKGLANSMLAEDGLLAPYIRSCIHSEIQHCVQLTIAELLVHASKKKGRPIRVDLAQIRTLATDVVDGTIVDESVFKSKRKGEFVIKSRPVGPSATQLELLRISIYNLYATRMNGKRPFEKDISKDNSRALEDFYHRSFNYSYLLNFKQCILEMIDLGDLWYREFYLELTKTLQFPIEWSLPWIVTDTILESGDLSMMEYVLYPLDIYNDAANRALSNLHQQFLYDEIEAEVNLCFDQLIFKLSNSIYTSYKTHASSILLDNPFRSGLEQLLGTKLQFPKTRYDVILSQRHYQLLGRFVDLNDLIGQRINNLLRKNIDNAIARFLVKDLSSIVELETQLNVIKLTHELLSKNFAQLDEYDSLFNEVNGSASLVSYHSRIAFHIISECASDFLSHYNYNASTNRFVRCVIEFGDPVQRDNLPSQQLHWQYGDKRLTVAYGAYHANFSKIFGIRHAISLLNVLGPQNLSLIIDEILTHIHLKIDNVLVPYVSELLGAMPPNSKCPLYDYKLSGGIGYFSGKLIDIIHYPPLQSDVFQQFKEVGNTIAFLLLLDLAQEELSSDAFPIASSFLGINPSNLDSPPEPATAPLYSAVKSAADYLKSNDGVCPASVDSLEPLLSTFWECDYNIRQRSNHSLFISALDRIYASVASVRDDWDQQTPEEGAVIPVECSREFYRLFSAMKYIFCLPPERGQGEYDNFDLFGDGFLWGGLSIIHFLGQRKRFNAFDFSDHLLNVAQVYPPEPSEKLPLTFISNASRVKQLSGQIFQMLGNYMPEYQPFIVQIHPPIDDSDASQFKITSSRLDESSNLRASDALRSPRKSNQNPVPVDLDDLPPPPNNPPPPPPPSP